MFNYVPIKHIQMSFVSNGGKFKLKGPYTPSVLFEGLACACKYVIQVCQKHTLSGMFVKLVCVNSKSCPHTNENLYDSTRFAQTKFSKIRVSDRFLSAVMYVHTSISLSNVFDIFAVWLNFGFSR
jgi:hypothetical protein